MGGSRESGGKKGGIIHRDLSNHPTQTLIPDLWQPNGKAYHVQQSVGIPTDGKYSQALCKARDGVGVSWTPSSFVPRGRTETKHVIHKVPNTRPLQNRWLSCSCGINTVNQAPTTLVYSTCAYYPCVRIWKQLLLDVSAQSFYVCCFFFFGLIKLI